jgi:hypothetical protein
VFLSNSNTGQERQKVKLNLFYSHNFALKYKTKYSPKGDFHESALPLLRCSHPFILQQLSQVGQSAVFRQSTWACPKDAQLGWILASSHARLPGHTIRSISSPAKTLVTTLSLCWRAFCQTCNAILHTALSNLTYIGLISVRCDYQGLVCLDLMLIYLGENVLGCLL